MSIKFQKGDFGGNFAYGNIIMLCLIGPSRKLSGVFNTTASYNSIDLIPNGLVWVSDTDMSRKETSLSFLLFELVWNIKFRN